MSKRFTPIAATVQPWEFTLSTACLAWTLSTGSLGQGLSVAVRGQAYGLRLRHSSGRRFRTPQRKGAEMQRRPEYGEGHRMFCRHHRLANLTAVVDLNGTQGLGSTKHVLDLEPMADKWRAFGWDTC